MPTRIDSSFCVNYNTFRQVQIPLQTSKVDKAKDGKMQSYNLLYFDYFSPASHLAIFQHHTRGVLIHATSSIGKMAH